LLTAKPKHYDKPTMDEARRWVHGYQTKFGPSATADPPDDTILAQLLAIAPLQYLIRLLQDLMSDRQKAGDTYAWFVTVALQRIHGIAPAAFKAKRAEFKAIKGGRKDKAPAPGDTHTPGFSAELVAGTAAKVRNL
jgi:hypothetical protein